ncbi:hypothetical protein ACHQM5_001376 [Ranunculus cassubicifolius]
MGIIRNNFIFLMGTVCGVFIAQNYNVPNIDKTAKSLLEKFKEMEEKYRKDKENARRN